MLHKGDIIETLGFTELHAAILRIGSPNTLNGIMSSTKREIIDQRDHAGKTALAWAAELGDIDHIQWLLLKGADPNAVSLAGRTPLSCCAFIPRCLNLLLKAGADANHLDHAGHSTMTILIRNKDDADCIETLWRWGADLSPFVVSTTVERNRPQTLKWLLRHGVDLEQRNSAGDTSILHFLECTNDSYPVMLEILLEVRPKCSVVNNFQEGVLHYIARFSSFNYLRLFEQKANLSDFDPQQRSTRGLKVLAECDPGKTPMEIAEWRRDHQLEWSCDCATTPDSDPQAWFAAFEAFIQSIIAAKALENGIGLGPGAEAAVPELSNNPFGDDAKMSMDFQNPFRVPGSYPAT